MEMPGGAREWKRVRRPSLRGMSSLKRTSSVSMLLMRRTRSLVSQVSYCVSAGMVLGVVLAGRGRLGEDPWLERWEEGAVALVVVGAAEDRLVVVAEESFTRVAEELVSAQDVVPPVRLTDI